MIERQEGFRFMDLTIESIGKKADALVRRFETRDPEFLAAALGVTILPRPFKAQKGAYMTQLRNRYIFIREGLKDDDPAMYRIVLAHELGHDALHRAAAKAPGAFREFNLFDMRESRLEYEANVFAAELLLPDDEVLDCIAKDYDIYEIAAALHSDVNLVALKNDLLIRRGHRFRPQEHENTFLKKEP